MRQCDNETRLRGSGAAAHRRGVGRLHRMASDEVPRRRMRQGNRQGKQCSQSR
ncbi:hypothetical protein M885DRAFT_537603 [Pelagophyceae sp. CCMP2097]|nr:hypothetical protein M885DRAFT_537603 [Pelagophyceae sp. CCMP2097]